MCTTVLNSLLETGDQHLSCLPLQPQTNYQSCFRKEQLLESPSLGTAWFKTLTVPGLRTNADFFFLFGLRKVWNQEVKANE